MDENCGGCTHLKFCRGIINYHDGRCYCEKNGINLSGTLERHDKCKKENWKCQTTNT